MRRVECSVDHDLRILTCTKYGRSGEECLSNAWEGKFYYEVLPRICRNGVDAVVEVLAEGEAVVLPDFPCHCLYLSFPALVEIRPVRSRSGTIEAAQLVFDFPVGCCYVDRLSQSQPLIDIGKTASLLAHGVRNPLNAIKGAVTYLKSRYRQDGTFLEFGEIIEQEIANLDTFISRFLSTSLDSFDPVPVELQTLLQKIEAIVSMQGAATGVEVELLASPSLRVCINRFQVEHALLNILNNALQAMPEGGRISIESLRDRSGNGSFARIEIADDGPGIPGEERLEGSLPLNKPERRGRGFGLFLAREVFQKHGGSLEILSEQGKGTRVVVRLPAEPGSSAEEGGADKG